MKAGRYMPAGLWKGITLVCTQPPRRMLLKNNDIVNKMKIFIFATRGENTGMKCSRDGMSDVVLPLAVLTTLLNQKAAAMPAFANITLRAIAPGEEGALAQLFQLYCYDNSAWSGEDVLAGGRYDVCDAALAEYVHAPGHAAVWVEADGALAGFFVTEPGMAGAVPVREFSDFFILKKYRRQGLALEVVRRVLLGSDTTWLVAMFRADAAANAFWQQAFARLPFARVEPWHDAGLPQFQLYLLKPAA